MVTTPEKFKSLEYWIGDAACSIREAKDAANYFFEYHYEDLHKLGHGANQLNMNAALIRSFPLSFPKADEQADIVVALESLDTKILIHGRKRQQLHELVLPLLQELMTAKTRIHEIEFSTQHQGAA